MLTTGAVAARGMDRTEDAVTAAPTLNEAVSAGRAAMERAWAAANRRWVIAAETWILDLPRGTRFLAEEAVIAVTEAGFKTRNNKAMGGVMNKASNADLIAMTGAMQPSRTSHGQMRPEWIRL